MNRYKQKLRQITDSKRIKQNKKILYILTIILIGFILLSDFLPYFQPHKTHILEKMQQTIHNTKSVHFFKNTPKNRVIVVNQPIRSTGCGASVSLPVGRATYMTFSKKNTKRRFLIYLPKSYNNAVMHPVILAFHGYANTPFGFEKFSHFDTVADAHGMIIIYPEGSTSLTQLRGWNTGLHPTIITNDVLFISNLLNTVQDNLCINPKQIYATGFSNGGGFVALLACQLSGRIAAFAPVSGSYVTAFKSCKATRPVPIIEFHGNKDRTVPYLGLIAKKELGTLKWISDWAKRNGCAQTPRVMKKRNKITNYTWTNCNDNAAVIHYKIVGERHAWPHILFAWQQNNQITNLNAATMIWNFFKQHPLRQEKTAAVPASPL